MNSASKLLKITLLALTGAVAIAAPSSAAEGTTNGKIAFFNGLTTDSQGRNTSRLKGAEWYDALFEFSPDGTKLAWVTTPLKGKGGFFVGEPDGSARKRISGSDVVAARWTDDGSRIVYMADRDEAPGNEIYSVNPDGSGEALLADDGTALSDVRQDDVDPSAVPSFSVRGDHIAYPTASSDTTDSEIVVMDLDGGDKVQLTNDDLDDVQPTISPDGASILFTRLTGESKAQIMRMGIDGSGQTALTPANEFSTTPIIAPNGSKVAYDSDGTVWTMNPDGTGQDELLDPSRSGYVSGISPDSSRVVYDVANYYGEGYYTMRSFSIGINGTGHRRLVTQFGDWQPLSAPEVEPKLKIRSKAASAAKNRPPAVIVSCSNECDVTVKATGKLGGERVKTKGQAVGIYGGSSDRIPAISPKAFRGYRGDKGKLNVSITAVDDYGQEVEATTEVKVG